MHSTIYCITSDINDVKCPISQFDENILNYVGADYGGERCDDRAENIQHLLPVTFVESEEVDDESEDGIVGTITIDREKAKSSIDIWIRNLHRVVNEAESDFNYGKSIDTFNLEEALGLDYRYDSCVFYDFQLYSMTGFLLLWHDHLKDVDTLYINGCVDFHW